MADHTPLPWRVEQPNPDRPIFIIINKKYGIVVHRTTGGDAEFIVRACNSFDLLLQTLKDIASNSAGAIRDKANYAIAKAEEGKDVE